MQHGNCHLCGLPSELVDSHIWPSFGYKRYVSNQTRGGKFVDLLKGKPSNRQYTEYWFCKSCDTEFLSGLENRAAAFCKEIDDRPDGPYSYDEHLLPFLVSISWRVAKYEILLGRVAVDETFRRTIRDWKEHLNLVRSPRPGKHPRLKPHSQHLFIVTGKGEGCHRALGGLVYAEDGIVFSQVGPLVIAGLLDRSRFSLADIKAWEASAVAPDGGMITPFSEGRIAHKIPSAFDTVLAKHERGMWRAIRTMRELKQIKRSSHAGR